MSVETAGNRRPAVPNVLKLDELGNSILPMLDALREAEPIVWNEAARAWMILRYEDVLAGFQGKYPLTSRAITPQVFSAIPEEEQAKRIPVITNSVYTWMINTDPPEHRRLRNVMMKGFTNRIIEASRASVRELVEQTLDTASLEPECDIIESAMQKVTVGTIAHLIGLPLDQLENIKSWSESVANAFTRPQAALTPDLIDAAEQGFAGMAELFRQEIAKRRLEPTDDFLSQLVSATSGAAAVSEEELIGQLLLLLPSGHESTTNSMALVLVILLRNPEIREEFLTTEQPSDALMELMRFAAMSTVMNRLASEDFVWHGNHIKKGDAVLLVIASANRDPEKFQNPKNIDLTRPNGDAVVFGSGAHHCIGHLLAKMEATEFLTAVLRRFPNLELCDEDLEWTSAISFRGLKHLRVRWNQTLAA